MERHTVTRLIGAPPGYVGFDQGGLLTDGIDQHPALRAAARRDREGASRPVQHPPADHGSREADRPQRQAGRLPQRHPDHDDERRRGRSGQARPSASPQSKREGDDNEAINRLFAPEFRNRLDAIISFGQLPKEVVSKVVDKFVPQLEAQLADRNVTIELTDEARDWLVEHGYDETMGARPMARLIQQHIKTPLADEVLFGQLKNGGAVRVIVVDEDERQEGARLRVPGRSDHAQAREGRRRGQEGAREAALRPRGGRDAQGRPSRRPARASPVAAVTVGPGGAGPKGGDPAASGGKSPAASPQSAPYRRCRWYGADRLRLFSCEARVERIEDASAISERRCDKVGRDAPTRRGRLWHRGSRSGGSAAAAVSGSKR